MEQMLGLIFEMVQKINNETDQSVSFHYFGENQLFAIRIHGSPSEQVALTEDCSTILYEMYQKLERIYQKEISEQISFTEIKKGELECSCPAFEAFLCMNK